MIRVSKGTMRRAAKKIRRQELHDLWEAGKKGGMRLIYRPARVKGKVYPYASTKRMGGGA